MSCAVRYRRFPFCPFSSFVRRYGSTPKHLGFGLLYQRRASLQLYSSLATTATRDMDRNIRAVKRYHYLAPVLVAL